MSSSAPRTWRRWSSGSDLSRKGTGEPGLFEAAGLDLDVTLGPNNWIRRRSDPVVAVELTGELGIEKEPGGKLDVRGDIRALPGRSFVELVGRRFELMRGGAQLKGPLDAAQLDSGSGIPRRRPRDSWESRTSPSPPT